MKESIPEKRTKRSKLSEEIKIIRLQENIITHYIFFLYPKLHFISIKFGFNVKELLELLLENIYNEDKIGSYAHQIGQSEKGDKPLLFSEAILQPILKQYMAAKEIEMKTRWAVLEHLHVLSNFEPIIIVYNSRLWKLNFFYLKNSSEIKFYPKSKIDAKINRILKNLLVLNVDDHGIFKDFLKHMKGTLFLNTADQNKEIENILTSYYLQFNKMQMQMNND